MCNTSIGEWPAVDSVVRAYVTPDDIKAIAMDVLRHRVVVTYEAEAEEVSSEDIVRRIFEYLPVP